MVHWVGYGELGGYGLYRSEKHLIDRKLESYGVLYKNLARFAPYLSKRVQYCRVKGVDSKIDSIKVGVPPGLCLGLLLFLVILMTTQERYKIPLLPFMLTI